MEKESPIWHPLSRLRREEGPITIVKAQGVWLYSEEGKRYLDGISSWGVNLHGHGHSYIVQKIQEQALQLDHVILADFSHYPAQELAARLLSHLPGNLSKIFYSDNGSTAVEVALKMALQYWHNENPGTKRKKIICFEKSYHGDTLGAMSASGNNPYAQAFTSYLFQPQTICPPFKGQEKKSLLQIEQILQKEESACFIFEPMMVGFCGEMRPFPAEGLDALIRLCKKHQVLTIGDEALTGFGRTGPLFACENLKEKPDMICLAKGITGGFLPLAATACSRKVYERFLSKDDSKTFFHSHSYMANPIGCAAALASLDLLTNLHCTRQRKTIEEQHQTFCDQVKGDPRFLRCDHLGTLLSLEYAARETSYSNPLRYKLYKHFLDRGILLRPLGNVVYLIPPYCVTPQELQLIYNAILEFHDY